MIESDLIMLDRLTSWIKEEVTSSGCRGTVVGLSGGIDSAVTAALASRAFPAKTLVLIMPCASSPQDKEDALLVAKTLRLEYRVVDLTETHHTFLQAVGEEGRDDSELLARANTKARLRMAALYYYAGLKNSLVVGTGNRSELAVGYFTKYGDGGVDLEPLGKLVKSQVRALAGILGIPEKIIEKPPSAGLWLGQRDEKELGISYDQLDRYLLTGKAPDEVKERIEELSEQNKHKLEPPRIPDF